MRHLDTAEDVEEIIEEDGPNVDHKLDKFSGGGVLDGAGAFVQKKHEAPVEELMNRQ